MRTVAGILFFETIPIIMKILWESLSDRLLLDHVETECGNREVFQRHSFYFHLGCFDHKGKFFIFICILTLFFCFYGYFYSNLRIFFSIRFYLSRGRIFYFQRFRFQLK